MAAGDMNGTRRSTGRHDSSPPPIAIVGMGMRLPGGISDADTFYSFLSEMKDARGDIPQDRFSTDGFHSEQMKPGFISMTKGYFLDTDIAKMDAGFFSMSKSEVERLDPQQRLLLEVVYEAFQNAGEKHFRGENIACYVGAFGEDWLDLHARDTQDLGMYRITGAGDFVLANRISYEYDLKGPSMTIRVACSSSMVSLHLACEALASGSCSGAIVGGSNILLTPIHTIAMCEQGNLSPEASCRSFDANANGYARADAINAIYIKRLDDAIRDGNPIRAIIRATSSNCDGKTPGIASPSSQAHEALIRRAYDVAGLKLEETAMCECHGTGTKVGDPLEVNAVANVWGEEGILIGSVKPNIGHSEGASGVSSVIKAVLSLENKTIIPNIKFETPNPAILWEKAKISVPTSPLPWPKGRKERISVNSFGIGGANAHVIIESAASYLPYYLERMKLSSQIIRAPGYSHSLPITNGTHNGRGSESNGFHQCNAKTSLLVFSANHLQSLNTLVQNTEAYYSDHKPYLSDLAYTLGARREHLSYRSFALADGVGSFEIGPTVSKKASARPSPVFVFTGQGSQWPEMGVNLMADYTSFRYDIKAMDAVLHKLPQSPEWSIEEELLKVEGNSRVEKAEFSQPLTTAIQVALVNLLRSFGVQPSAVIGHSSGEIAAAYAAQALTMEEAITVAYFRGMVTKLQKRRGGMAAIGLGRQDVSAFMSQDLTIACENSGTSVTISGAEDELDRLIDAIKKAKPDVLARRLRVEMAYHSKHMEEISSQYKCLLQGRISPRFPTVPFYSTVTGKVLTQSHDFGPSYWQANLCSPVLFYSGVNLILKENALKQCPHLEIGPHSAMAGPLRQIYKELRLSVPYISALIRKENSSKNILNAIGQLFTLGVEVDFASMNVGGKTLPNLPTYPWYRDVSYWSETRVMKAWRSRKFPPHDLLGSRVWEASETEPVWRNVLRLENVPWICDHVVQTNVVYPAAGYISMAGVAVKQLTGVADYTIREVTISTARVLQQSEPTEMITTMRPLKLTTTLDSPWFEFSIVSHGPTGWIKHCQGQVRPGPASEYAARVIKPLPRKVSPDQIYKTMKRAGLEYGPEFARLQDISVDVAEKCATAMITQRQDEPETYALHPTALDLMFQLVGIGLVNGQSKKFDKTNLPTYIQEMYVGEGARQNIHLQSAAQVSQWGVVTGSGFSMTTEGKPVISLRGLRLSPLESEITNGNPDTHAAVALEWKPCIDFLDAGSLMSPVRDIRSSHELYERLALLCIIENVAEITGQVVPDKDHFKKLIKWMKHHIEKARAGNVALIPDAPEIISLSSAERQTMIKKLYASNAETACPAVGRAIYETYKAFTGILNGQANALENLVKDGILTDYYKLGDVWDYKEFVDLSSHANPTLRILEIGAGTGSVTEKILECLKTSHGDRRYSKYVYTDISAGFFIDAQNRFKDYTGIEYRTLDISKDPLEQGFEEGSFDLIIASNVIHATPRLSDSLGNVRKLLHSRGRFLLQELCCSSKNINYVMGVLPGWWLGEEDGRPDEPYISPERWDKELRASGFDGLESFQLDHEQPYQVNANILARPAIARPNGSQSSSNRVTILAPDHQRLGSHTLELANNFKDRGFEISYCSLQEAPPANEMIVSAMDLEAPYFSDIDEERLRTFTNFVSSLRNCRILWLTRAAQVYTDDPRYAIVIGLARTIRSELSLPFSILELDDLNQQAWDATVRVTRKVQAGEQASEQLDPDYEFALSNGVVHISRFGSLSVDGELAKISVEDAPTRLQIGKRGLLQTLRWVQLPWDPLEPDEVEVEVRAVGMNFKDVLRAMGVIEGHKIEANSFGCECSGVIRKIGPNVHNVKVGDRVMVFSGQTLCTRLKTLGYGCVKIPDSLSFEDASTMPLVYATAIRSLLDIGRLQSGQTVLIHSASGGVGIAAMHICKSLGAEIFATVGTPEKASFLTTNFGIPADHIFHSRDSSFLQDVMKATGGRGVDIVLNSLSGEQLHASWECVAECGIMVEIGKRDFIGHGKLALDIFEANRGYFGVDVAQLYADRRADGARLLEKIMEMYNAGQVKPIGPITTFDAQDIEEALRFLQKGQHIGKVVVHMPNNPDTLKGLPTPLPLTFRPDVTYLLAGGLGGLGKAVAVWMVERGARDLLFLSRSAADTDMHGAFFGELRSMGCSIQGVSGNVANIEDVKRAVKASTKRIAGVLQLSMVLKDQTFSKMSLHDWNVVHDPKVKGTWNLHQTLDSDLDFFVIFSSFSGLIGQPGQANYAAANSYLDAFTQYRHRLGLPASVLDIGCVEDIGYVSQNSAVLEVFRGFSVHMLRERDLLESLELMIRRSMNHHPQHSKPQAGGFQNIHQLGIGLRSTLPLSDPQNRNIWKRDPRFGVYHNRDEDSASSASPENEGLRQFLSNVASDPTRLDVQINIEFLAHEIGIRVYSFLMRPEDEVDVSLTLSAAGIDSLIAIELRNWWRHTLGTEITVLELLNGGTISQLGELAARNLKRKYGRSDGGGGVSSHDGPKPGKEDIDVVFWNKAF